MKTRVAVLRNDFEALRRATLEFAAQIAESEEKEPSQFDAVFGSGVSPREFDFALGGVRATKKSIAKRIRAHIAPPAPKSSPTKRRKRWRKRA